MAEAMARQLGRHRVEAFSAGLAPTGRVSEKAVTVLESMGYPAEGLFSKGFDAVPLETMDVVVSLLGEDGLRMFGQAAARLEAWSVRDPYGEDLRVFEAVGRDIEARVRTLLAEVGRPDEPNG